MTIANVAVFPGIAPPTCGQPSPIRRRRKPDTGLVRPYRPLPADFRETYLRLGQDKSIEEHYRTNWRVIRRWIEEAGGDELRNARSAVTGSKTKPGLRSKASRYVMGAKR